MKLYFHIKNYPKLWSSFAIALIIWLILFIPKPPLLENISFSQAVYDDQQHLLRLTLSKDDKYRLFTPLQTISPTIIKATLLQEDQYFYWHLGINPWALLKGIWLTYVTHSHRMGASTITMQVARLRFGINSKTIAGKLEQLFRALQIERYYSKDQILEAYLNLASYGKNIEGVGAASLIYFDKSAKQISLPEALTLCVIPQHPAQRAPARSSLITLKNIRDSLFLRWLQKYPNDIDQKSIMVLPLQMRLTAHLPPLAPHFVNTILTNSQNQSALITTLDLTSQKIVERVTQQYLQRKHLLNVKNATVLLVDTRTMAVKALLGSGNFFEPAIQGQIDGTRVKRSPGSTLKPFIYALALDQGLIHPFTVLQDAPHSFGAYDPENFDHDFMGPIKAKDALILSRNIPAIELAAQLKQPTLYQFLLQAHVANLKPESSYGLSLVLGGAELSMRELVSLYAMLANGGIWQPLRFKLDSNPIGTSDKKFVSRLLSREASFLVLNMLQETQRPVVMNAVSSLQNIPIAWKTGTSSGFRDAWSIAAFGPYVLAVWCGNFDASSNPAFVGKEIAAPLLFEIIAALETQIGPLPNIWPDPKRLNLVQVDVCEASGLLPTRTCPQTIKTWFIPGKSPIKTDSVYREVAINPRTGLRSCHLDQNNKFEVYEFWPSNLLKIFAAAGIQRRTPPPYDPECTLLNQFATSGMIPRITSPQLMLSYTIRANQKNGTFIPFTAIAEGDVKTLYWFVNEAFVGKLSRDQTLFWPAKPGKFTVRVVDDQGRADVHDLQVQMVS